MRFSIIIPSWNNLDYLKLCINSIKKNSKYDHDINVHLNEGNDGSLDFLRDNKIKFTHSAKNIGLCSGVNLAAKLAETNYIIYTNDDMYFLPDWDSFLIDELSKVKDNLYYLSGTPIGPLGSGVQHKETKKLNEDEIKNYDFDCGKTAIEFNEQNNLCKEIIENTFIEKEFQILGWRNVEINDKSIGLTAKSLMPSIEQIFISKQKKGNDIERELYIVRKSIEKKISDLKNIQDLDKYFYACSLSSKTIVYKGMLMAAQLGSFFLDLEDSDYMSAFSLVHSRFSTNTLGSWKFAHPYRFLAHN